jgi:hypothetical protein
VKLATCMENGEENVEEGGLQRSPESGLPKPSCLNHTLFIHVGSPRGKGGFCDDVVTSHTAFSSVSPPQLNHTLVY